MITKNNAPNIRAKVKTEREHPLFMAGVNIVSKRNGFGNPEFLLKFYWMGNNFKHINKAIKNSATVCIWLHTKKQIH